jgi:hypothetical protein
VAWPDRLDIAARPAYCFSEDWQPSAKTELAVTLVLPTDAVRHFSHSLMQNPPGSLSLDFA